MKIPVIRGTIDRRMLVNFRADPEIVAKLLPTPFRPLCFRGRAMVGICLIRLRHIRPRFLPVPWGIGSENTAHRIAVEWEIGGIRRDGVFIPRRDTSSLLNSLAGGSLFPGEHHRAAFTVHESGAEFDVRMQSRDGKADLHVTAEIARSFPNNSVFESIDEASQFFQRGSLGYSVTRNPARFDGLELSCKSWGVEPLHVSHVESSYFSDRTRFPEGSIEFDCALLMRGIKHEWLAREDVCGCPTAQTT